MNPSGGIVEIEDPALYTITFNDDGTLAIQADCNQINGTYALEAAEGAPESQGLLEGSSPLTITLGPATTAACPEGSLSDDFLQYLSGTLSFLLQANQLGLELDPTSGALVISFAAAE